MNSEDRHSFLRGMIVGPDEVKTLVRETLRVVRRLLEGPRKKLRSGLLVMARAGQLPPEITPVALGGFDTDEEKTQRYQRAGATFAGPGRVPVAAAVFAESWAAPAGPDAPRARD